MPKEMQIKQAQAGYEMQKEKEKKTNQTEGKKK